jgi:hypothetical protein
MEICFRHSQFNHFHVVVFLYNLASRLIRRRVPAAGHLMTPRRLWLNKIPTQCDVVIEFPGRVFYLIFSIQNEHHFNN